MERWGKESDNSEDGKNHEIMFSLNIRIFKENIIVFKETMKCLILRILLPPPLVATTPKPNNIRIPTPSSITYQLP